MNGDGAVFVAKRKPSKNLSSCWEFPGGKAEENEEPQAALRREYQEEFGVEIEVGDLFCTGQFFNRSKQFTLLAFNIEIKGSPECREHAEVGWKMPEELKDLDIVPSDRIILNNLL